MRNYEKINGDKRLIKIYGQIPAGKPPQLATLFKPEKLPSIINLYQVYDWNWGTNNRGSLISNPMVTLLSLASNPGDNLYPPFSTYDIGENLPVSTDPYQVYVLYAEKNRITLKYSRNDTVATGFTLHFEDICVDPNIYNLYVSNNLNIPSNRNALIAIRTRTPFGRSRTGEVKVAIRADGEFKDPRSCIDWWIDYQTGCNP
jgi:hypothetical protein